MSESEPEIGKLQKWAQSFKVLGEPLRLGILFMLYGSEVLSDNQKSLTLGQMRRILGFPNERRVESNLVYHLNSLLSAGFVEKEPRQVEKGTGRVEVIYHLSAKSRDFLKDFKIVDVIEEKIASGSRNTTGP